MIDRGVLALLGILCLLAPLLVALLDGVRPGEEKDMDADIIHWFASKPLNVIFMMQGMMFVGLLLLAVAAGTPRGML